MTTVEFLAEWALRSSILILGGALLLRALRVKDASIRLAAWTAMLCGSLAIPALTVALPKVPFTVMPFTVMGRAGQSVEAPAVPHDGAPALDVKGALRDSGAGPQRAGVGANMRFDWALAALWIYAVVALALLLRLCFGLAMSLRLLRGSRATDRATEGIEIRESDGAASPVTLGIVRPAIVLPVDWRQWDSAKLDAVLAHERSHIRRHDPALQSLSAIHRALLWFSPLSWFLHQRIVRVAEEASDDAAVTATCDRALYAQVLLDFMQRAADRVSIRDAHWLGVPMTRYGRADDRIHRILDGTTISQGVTRWSMAAILALGSPLAYMAAAAHPRSAAQPAQAVTAVATPVRAGTEAPVRSSGQDTQQHAPQANTQSRAVVAPAAKAESEPAYLSAVGNVAAYSITVRPRLDGQLISVSFKEGELVKAGQVLASIDARPYEDELDQALLQDDRDQSNLQNALADLARYQTLAKGNMIPESQVAAQKSTVLELEGRITANHARAENANLQLTYAKIVAPITGVAGFLLIGPGNVVHAGASEIVTINQIQPIAARFAIPEDRLPQVRARLRQGASLTVEAWNRDNTVKIATGHLSAVDNQIDTATGTVNLKAEFDNKDGALFPNQFVNVRLFISGQ